MPHHNPSLLRRTASAVHRLMGKGKGKGKSKSKSNLRASHPASPTPPRLGSITAHYRLQHEKAKDGSSTLSLPSYYVRVQCSCSLISKFPAHISQPVSDRGRACPLRCRVQTCTYTTTTTTTTGGDGCDIYIYVCISIPGLSLSCRLGR